MSAQAKSTSLPAPAPAPALSRDQLISDLALLRSLPSSSLSSLTSPASTSNATSTPQRDASAVLSGYTPSAATHDQSQDLARAYLSKMEEMRALQAGGEGDRVGERIDRLRERGTEIQEVLGELRV